MEDMKIVKSGLLIKVVVKAIEIEAKEQKGGFFRILLGRLGASLLGNLLADKSVIKAGEGTIRARQDL